MKFPYGIQFGRPVFFFNFFSYPIWILWTRDVSVLRSTFLIAVLRSRSIAHFGFKTATKDGPVWTRRKVPLCVRQLSLNLQPSRWFLFQSVVSLSWAKSQRNRFGTSRLCTIYNVTKTDLKLAHPKNAKCVPPNRRRRGVHGNHTLAHPLEERRSHARGQ